MANLYFDNVTTSAQGAGVMLKNLGDIIPVCVEEDWPEANLDPVIAVLQEMKAGLASSS